MIVSSVDVVVELRFRARADDHAYAFLVLHEPSSGDTLLSISKVLRRLSEVSDRALPTPPGKAHLRQGGFDVETCRRFGYNVLNTRAPQANTTRWGVVAAPGTVVPGTTFLRPSLFLGGRLLKFGAQVDF